ncbi:MULTISPECIES: putative ATP-grasp-modified RiPP [Streptomyces]|uniref:ATP-grasp-modified RiPP n=1 Tax=Streptomyces katsurahamanus TaxID=2577098 RepID=A0ABW9NYU4_9ACTN|nr:putative ATP-grasp-modified RiPP [Streptomyces katsurahamanus]MQS38472.1 putative ATP-grasp-modified RiPP [Streptomyces katsurahamanus]
MGTAVQPWGTRRLAPYPTTVELPFTRTEIDPETQTTRYLDATGQLVEMGEDGKHGTNKATASQTATGADGGGPQPPAPADSDALEDHVPD